MVLLYAQGRIQRFSLRGCGAYGERVRRSPQRSGVGSRGWRPPKRMRFCSFRMSCIVRRVLL